jgi:glycosidase
LIVDGNWRLDPMGKYRKIVGGTMNSALKMPDCAAGPELLAETLTSSASGEAKVRIKLRSASDGDKPAKVLGSIDRGKLAPGTWTIDDAAGAVDFKLTGLAKGKHTLSLRAFDAKGREALPIDLPFWVEDEAFDYRDGVLYMFMIDRYANGEKANDKPIGSAVHYDADWHGGDMQGALKVMQTGYFEKLGVRTIWLSPLNRQTDNHESGDGNQRYSAYHGYWPTRAREVEPRFGGGEALKAFVAEAHKRGLRVLLDLINNQVYKDHEYIAKNGSWFRSACQCGDEANNCGWSQKPFECLFQPYLPDINWNVPGAEEQFIADAVSWISDYDFDGFRVDAVKHVEANSIYNMRAELTRRFEQAGARIFMVGETAVGEGDNGTFFGERFENGFQWIDAYTGPNGLDGQFDFPTRHNMADGLLNAYKPLNEVDADLRKSETRYKPGNRHVRFLNGHDNPRIASVAARDGKIGCSWASGCRGDQLPPLAYSDPEVYARLRRGLTVLYTMPGVPYLYAGDEVAFGGGLDPDMRRNMLFAEPELQDVHMTKTQLTQQQIELRDFVRKLGDVRTKSKAIRRGDRTTLLAESDLWVYAWTMGSETALVVINRGGAVTRTVTSTGNFTSALGTGSAKAVSGGTEITIGAGEAGIFLAK